MKTLFSLPVKTRVGRVIIDKQQRDIVLKNPGVERRLIAIESRFPDALQQAFEKCQARSERTQRNHILWAGRAFVRLEYQRLHTEHSGYYSKQRLLREAIRAYRDSPPLTLSTTA